MTQSRPNYILELKDRTIEFVPHPNYDDIWLGLNRHWTEPELEKKLGATPVPQEELKLVYRLTFADDRCEWRTRSDCIPFKSHEDAEIERLRKALREICAVTNRDGGHYLHEHGEEEAVRLGIQNYHEWMKVAGDHAAALAEKDAEIERLKKALDQAIESGQMSDPYHEEGGPLYCFGNSWQASATPELAAYLKEKGQ